MKDQMSDRFLFRLWKAEHFESSCIGSSECFVELYKLVCCNSTAECQQKDKLVAFFFFFLFFLSYPTHSYFSAQRLYLRRGSDTLDYP